MKRLNKLTTKALVFIGLLSIAFISGCGKNNPTPDSSEQQNITGADGTSLIGGNGAPSSNTGQIGDFYLDKTNLNIYGPKVASGWEEPAPLMGRNGIDGKDGSQILSGTDVPALSLGVVGDFYFDKQNIAIYGPKTAEGWGIPVSLKDPSGTTVLLYKNHSFQTVTWNNYNHHDMESVIPIDSKYQDVYDNGIILVQIKQSNTADSYWFTILTFKRDGQKSIEAYLNLEDDNYYRPEQGNSIQKDKIKIFGYASEDYTEVEIQDFKIDIKIVFIPATTVIKMSAKNINTRDMVAVAKHLGL